ncbi:hypothetical protein BC826DRAFT_972335 [Russula brevipes]|nr:hypothetical protein BC826DRAFT_972335 [Russula brevipes]
MGRGGGATFPSHSHGLSRGKGSRWGLEGIEVKLVEDHVVSDLAQVRVIIWVGLDKPKVPVAATTLPYLFSLPQTQRWLERQGKAVQYDSSVHFKFGGREASPMGGVMDSGPSVTVDAVLGVAFASIGGGGLAESAASILVAV